MSITEPPSAMIGAPGVDLVAPLARYLEFVQHTFAANRAGAQLWAGWLSRMNDAAREPSLMHGRPSGGQTDGVPEPSSARLPRQLSTGVVDGLLRGLIDEDIRTTQPLRPGTR